MSIGDDKTEVFHFGDGHGITRTGRVVWIHPARRFYVVEFTIGGRKVRESYFFPGRGDFA